MARKRSGKSKKPKQPKQEDLSKVNPELWNRILGTDAFFSEIIDFIPPNQWGFDEETQEKLQEFRHKVTDRKLTSGRLHKI